MFEFRCKCGRVVTVAGTAVGCGNTKSCGCVKIDRCSKGLRRKFHQWPVAINRFYASCKNSAQKRGHEFSISRDDFSTIVVSNCHYCGLSPQPKYSNKSDGMLLSGIDRVDCRKGYVLGNVVPCCKECNYGKGRLSVKDFLAWVQRVSSFQTTKL